MLNNSVIEIISFLIQKILKEEDIISGEEEVVQELIELGYDLHDIDEAFALIYNSTDIIEEDNLDLPNFDKISEYNRIFTKAERTYIPVKLQGLIRKIMVLNVLTPKENEELILNTIQSSYHGLNSITELWSILEDVVADENKLERIQQSIPEFKEIIPGDYGYIN